MIGKFCDPMTVWNAKYLLLRIISSCYFDTLLV